MERTDGTAWAWQEALDELGWASEDPFMPMTWSDSGGSVALESLERYLDDWDLDGAAGVAAEIAGLIYGDSSSSRESADQAQQDDEEEFDRRHLVERLAALPAALDDDRVDLGLTDDVRGELLRLVAMGMLTSASPDWWWGNCALVVLDGRCHPWGELERWNGGAPSDVVELAVEESGLAERTIKNAPWPSGEKSEPSVFAGLTPDERAVAGLTGAVGDRSVMGLHLVSRRVLFGRRRLSVALSGLVQADLAEIPPSPRSLLSQSTASQLADACQLAGLSARGSKGELLDRLCSGLSAADLEELVGPWRSHHVLDVALGPRGLHLRRRRPPIAVWVSAVNLVLDELVPPPQFELEQPDSDQSEARFVAGAGYEEVLYSAVVPDLDPGPVSGGGWQWWRWLPTRRLQPYRTTIPSLRSGHVFDRHAYGAEVVDRTGTTRWNWPNCELLEDVLPIDSIGGEAVVGLEGRRLSCRLLHDGTELWSQRLGEEGLGLVAPPTRDGRPSLVLLQQSRSLVAFDASSGDETWRFSDGSRLASLTPVRLARSGDSTLIVLTTEDGLCCLDARSGDLRWSHRRRSKSYAMVDDDLVALAIPKATLVIDLADGSEIARLSRTKPLGFSSGALLFEPMRGGSLCGEGIDARTGEVLWTNDGYLRFNSWHAVDGPYFVARDSNAPSRSDRDDDLDPFDDEEDPSQSGRTRPANEPLLIDSRTGEVAGPPKDGSVDPAFTDGWSAHGLATLWYQVPGSRDWHYDDLPAVPGTPNWARDRPQALVPLGEGGWLVSTELGFGVYWSDVEPACVASWTGMAAGAVLAWRSDRREAPGFQRPQPRTTRHDGRS